MEIYPEIVQLTLPKPASYHCPIMIDMDCESWGPTPFRFELMWLEENQFPKLIQDWWKEIKVDGWAGHRLATKLKVLKNKIKEWAKESFGDVRNQKSQILAEIQALDIKEESDQMPLEEGKRRLELKEVFHRKVRKMEIRWRQ